ncbi:MAG TPA: MarR family transcriptional regulator [Tepidisphaeraceae bacterium]
MVRRVMDPYFARNGISAAQWAVLRNLHCAEGSGEASLRLADLGNRLLVRPPSVTHVVERLRVAGLLVRETSPSDHRAKCVRLTDGGRELVERVLGQHGRQVSNVMSGLNRTEQATLCALLDKLNTHLEHVAPTEYGSGDHPTPDGAAADED